MSKVKIRSISVALLIMIAISTATPVLATSTLNRNKDALEKDKKDIQQNIEETSNISKEIHEEIKALDKQVMETYDELERVEVDLAELEADIKDNLIQLDEYGEMLEEKKNLFDARLRVMYTNGTVGYLELLLSSKDIKDFFSRIEMVKTIVEHDKEMMRTMSTQNNRIEKKNSELIKQRESLTTLKSSVEAKSMELENATAAKFELIQKLELDKEQLEEEYDVLHGLSSDIDAEIIKLEEGEERVEESRMMATPISKQSDVIDKLNNMREGYNSVNIDFSIPYVYGGNSSTALDCSAFTMGVYRQLGVNLPRTSQAQAKIGKQISREGLKPGDLVIFSGTYKSGPSHTGIYLGAGEFIHQSSSGKGTTISKLTGYYSRYFSYGRRFW